MKFAFTRLGKIVSSLGLAGLLFSGLTAPAHATVALPTYADEVLPGTGGLQNVESVGDKLWITTANTRTVYVVDKATLATDYTISLPAAAGYTVETSVDANYLWIQVNGASSVARVNLTTRAVDNFTTGLCPNNDIFSDGTFVWVTCTTSNKLLRLSASTGAKLSETTLSGAGVVASNGTDVWVSYSSGTLVAKINPATGSPIAGLNAVATGFSSTSLYSMDMYGTSFYLSPNGGANVKELSTTDGSLVRNWVKPSAVGTQMTIVYEGSLWFMQSGASSMLQYNLYNLTAGAPTLEGTVNFQFGSGARNAVFDGTYMWVADIGGRLGKYAASYQSATAAPSAPGTPTATAGDTTASISWTASATGTAPITYTVESSPAGGTCTVTDLTAVCTGLTNGVTYHFNVVATNNDGTATSENSNDVVPMVAPSAPGTPDATVGVESASLSWDAPNTGTAPFTYTITSSPAGANCTVTDLTASCTGLTSGTSYSFKVTASNGAGSADSGWSNSVVPPIAPIAPGTPTATAGNGFVTVTWNAPYTGTAPFTYNVHSNPGGASCSVSGTTAICNGLTSGVAYTFDVTASNLAGSATSPESNSVTVVIVDPIPKVAPLKPSTEDVQVSPRTNSLKVTLSWQELHVYEPTSYVVTASPSGNSCIIYGAAGSCTILGLNSNTTYTLSIVARNKYGSSPALSVRGKTWPGSSAVVSSALKSITNFGGNSAVLTKAMKAAIKVFLQNHASAKSFTCTGYTAGKPVLKSDKALARARARAVCGYIHTLRPTAEITTSGSTPGLPWGPASRKVVIKGF